jgi:hypothetical protein
MPEQYDIFGNPHAVLEGSARPESQPEVQGSLLEEWDRTTYGGRVEQPALIEREGDRK